MKFQYVFGNPTRKKKSNPKRKSKNPQRGKAEFILPSGRVTKAMVDEYPEVQDVTLVKNYLSAINKRAAQLKKDYDSLSSLGNVKEAKKAKASFEKQLREYEKYKAMLADMNTNFTAAEKKASALAGKGYEITREIKRGGKWYTEPAWEAKNAPKPIIKKVPKGKKKAEKKVKVPNWKTTLPKLEKGLSSLMSKIDEGEALSILSAGIKKGNPTKSKGKKKMAKTRKKRKKSKKLVAPKGYAKIGKKGVSRPAFRKLKKKKSKKYYMITKAGKKGRKQVRKFSVRRSNPKRSNPVLAFAGGMTAPVADWTGYNVAELGALGMGGLLYGAANGVLSRIPYVNKVHAMLMKVPVVGSSLPTLVLGAVLHKLGEKQRIGILSQIGQGLVGASVVGMGVSASQMVPALRVKPLAGVDFTVGDGPDFGQGPDFGDYEQSAADFGSIPEGLAGIPEGLSGVDYTVGEAQMGGVDYTVGEEDYMDGIPEGLGEGQMG